MSQEGFSFQNRSSGISRRFLGSEENSRRLFGWDFTFAIFFLAIVFYFFWPLVFQVSEPYAPESSIQNVFSRYKQIMESCRVRIQEIPSNQNLAKEDIQKILDSFPQEVSPPCRILISDRQGTVVSGHNQIPREWNQANLPWKKHSTGIFIFRHQGKASLILYEPIPRTDLNLVIVQPFKPLFERTPPKG